MNRNSGSQSFQCFACGESSHSTRSCHHSVLSQSQAAKGDGYFEQSVMRQSPNSCTALVGRASINEAPDTGREPSQLGLADLQSIPRNPSPYISSTNSLSVYPFAHSSSSNPSPITTFISSISLFHWSLDSGASHHMCNTRSQFISFGLLSHKISICNDPTDR